MHMNVEWDGEFWLLKIENIGIYAKFRDVDVLTEFMQSIIRNITAY